MKGSGFPEKVAPTYDRERDLFTVAPELYSLEPRHLRIASEMATRHRPRMAALAQEYARWMAQRVPPWVMEAWITLVSGGWTEEALDALVGGDVREYVRFVKSFGKGMAEAGVPFYCVDTFNRGYEEFILPLVIEAYGQDAAGLRQALEARHRLLQIHVIATMEGYMEVYATTIGHLQEEIREAVLRPDTIWYSMLEVDGMLGLESLHPRMVARRILERVEYPGTIEARDGTFVHLGPHVMVHDCQGNPATCLSGFLAEAKVEKLQGQAVQVESIRLLPDDQCEVVLRPVLGGPSDGPTTVPPGIQGLG